MLRNQKSIGDLAAQLMMGITKLLQIYMNKKNTPTPQRDSNPFELHILDIFC